MLKEFRSIDVYWDKATRRIYEEIRTSSSDEKGRKLTVQIVNDGQIQDLSAVSLNLYWETEDGQNKGLDPFDPLDAENGIYELYFRTGMLANVGRLKAHLHLVDVNGAITSEQFTIIVFEGVDVNAMASDDELSTLNQALIEVQNVKQAEIERVANEESRISAEAERITSEANRVENENARQTAETERLTEEETRIANETDRVTAETDRVTAETDRVTAESGRVTAEQARVEAEDERATKIQNLESEVQNLKSANELKTVTQKQFGTGDDFIYMTVPIPTGYKATPFSWSFKSAGSLSVYNIMRTASNVQLHFGKLGGGNISTSQFAEVTIDFYKK